MEDDFGKYLEQSLNSLTLNFKPGQQVRGRVTAIDRKNVFVDIQSTSEGIISCEELRDENGELPVSVGDEIEAFYVSTKDDGINLSVKMSGKNAHGHLEEAYSSGIPIEGKVLAERKGGYTVKVGGEEAFCPFSQMSLSRGNPEDFIGNTYSFNISELNQGNFVVSRRKILEQEREKRREDLKDELEVGMILDGRVATVKDFGAFVDLGGVQGFIPASEFEWSKNRKPEDVISEGDQVRVAVSALNWAENKITLSYREANSPWGEIIKKYSPGQRCEVTITRLAHFGAFAELEAGLEGLIHISKLGAGKRINSPKEVVDVGDVVEVEIDSIDEESHRIALSRNLFGLNKGGGKVDGETADEASDDSSDRESIEIKEGARLTGIVSGIKPFGVFVRLSKEQTGLLHISEADIPRNTVNTFKALSDKFKLDSSLDVVVKEIKGDRISLASVERQNRLKSEAESQSGHTDTGSDGFGSLGGLFDAL